MEAISLIQVLSNIKAITKKKKKAKENNLFPNMWCKLKQVQTYILKMTMMRPKKRKKQNTYLERC